jgi:hypothetical protein
MLSEQKLAESLYTSDSEQSLLDSHSDGENYGYD